MNEMAEDGPNQDQGKWWTPYGVSELEARFKLCDVWKLREIAESDPHLFDNRQAALAIMQGDPYGAKPFRPEILELFSLDLRADRQVVEAAVSIEGRALQYATQELCADKDLVYLAVSSNPNALGFATDDLRADRDLALRALSHHYCFPEVLGMMSQDLRADREVVMKAVTKWGTALEYASADLQADPEIVRLAVANSRQALAYAAPSFQSDRDFVLSTGAGLEYASPELQSDRDFVYELISQGGWIDLKFASRELRSDRELVQHAIAQDAVAFRFASPELRADHELARQAISYNGMCLMDAATELQGDRELVELAISQNAEAFRYASEELQEDRDFAREAVSLNGIVLGSLPKELQDDKDLQLLAIQTYPSSFLFCTFRDDPVFAGAVIRLHGHLIEDVGEALKGRACKVLESLNLYFAQYEITTEASLLALSKSVRQTSWDRVLAIRQITKEHLGEWPRGPLGEAITKFTDGFPTQFEFARELEYVAPTIGAAAEQGMTKKEMMFMFNRPTISF